MQQRELIFLSSCPFRQTRVDGDYHHGQDLVFKELCSIYHSHCLWSYYFSGWINSYWHWNAALEKSFRALGCLLYIFLYINYKQITRSSQEIEWSTSPTKVLWANSGLHQLLPSRTIDVPLTVHLRNGPVTNSKCSLTDLVKRPGPAGWFSKEEEKAEGVRCSLGGNRLIYGKLSLDHHTSTLFTKFCRILIKVVLLVLE